MMLDTSVKFDFLLGYAIRLNSALFDTSFIIQNTSIHYNRFAGPKHQGTMHRICSYLMINLCSFGCLRCPLISVYRWIFHHFSSVCSCNFSALRCVSVRFFLSSFFSSAESNICYCLTCSIQWTPLSRWMLMIEGGRKSKTEPFIYTIFVPFPPISLQRNQSHQKPVKY